MILVAGARPFAQERGARLLAVVPVHDRAGRAADQQLAHLAPLHRQAVIVDELDVVARHRLAGGAVPHVAGAVRQEDVQHLGRADAVENVDAVAFDPALADVLRQRLAGRHAAAEFRPRTARRVRACEERRVERRHRVEHGDRMLPQQRRDPVRRRPVGQQHRGGAGRHRKCQRIAEAIGEEQLGHRIADVVLGDAENRPAVEIVGQLQVGMDMHRALRLAGRARGVEPESDVVARGRRGSCSGRRTGDQFFERVMAVRVLARDDDMLEIGNSLRSASRTSDKAPPTPPACAARQSASMKR